MPKFLFNQIGFAPLIAILLTTIITSFGLVASKTLNLSGLNYNIQPSPNPTPSLEPTPILTPTPSPTILPTPSPTQTPNPVIAPPPPPAVSGPPQSGYSYINVATERGNFNSHIVSIPASSKMVTDTASDSDCANDCPTIPLADYVSRNGGFAGINGSYFCPADYPDCSSKKNSFDFPIYNSRLSKWVNQGNLSWDGRSMVYQNGSMLFHGDAKNFGGGLSAGITNYPGLLNGGNVIIGGFSQSEKQTSKGTKTGIGFNESTIYLVVASNVDMADLAGIFKSLGAKNALNLDGGGSVALWYGGYKVGPGRNLPNAIIFK